MRLFSHASVWLALAGLSTAAPAANLELPQPSPQAVVALDIGTTEVRVDYHRPGVKGRKIWGGLVPYGEFWRLGANNATKLSVSDPFTIAGKQLPAGSYALFAVPAEKSWKIVLNSKAEQWGAYFHDAALDVHSFEVTPSTAPFAEWMAFDVSPTAPGTAEIGMRWENLRIAFDISVDVQATTWKKVDEALKDPAAAGIDPWEVHYQAAKYSLATNERNAEAMGWAEKAAAIKSSFRNPEIRADLLARDGRFAEAVVELEKAIEMSTAAGAPEAWRTGARAKRDGWAKSAAGKANASTE